MSPPDARIRLYQAEDEKTVRFAIGKSNLEGLATANKKSSLHFVTLIIWIALSVAMVEYMQWWPKLEQGFIGYLGPLPAFGAMAVPFIALFDWINRPQFEDLAQEALRGPDIPDMLQYYSRSPASGLWILEFDGHSVGICALDASLDSETKTLSPASGRFRAPSKGTSKTAVIRHFFIDEPYRKVDIQKDLLHHGIQHAFNADAKLQRIKMTCSSLTSYVQKCLKDEGFTFERHTSSLGVYGWKTSEWALERERFEKKDL
ncbi:hypothetical protein Moror_15264 [Moniliophthora roreri MCA 2997]|uniref:N-acetyltransferase domain-containing protein n=2 Tax=Moniliophthora roreri TaxID=221103 RepID=V2X247_MONRO|nr:hypothetical protein Moror_15264 [Moniliophthora roreri MCA 2997]KAI3622625.1 hypothetical protein WG66_015378 [Moniliophthora roreri]